MPQPPSAYDVHQRERWLRRDAHLWLRHDYARWLKPGADPEEVYPHLKRQREAAEDAAFAAQIAASQRVLTMLRAEVDEMKAALARRRLEEAKYSPSQPRVPKRNPGGGQFTRIGGGVGQSPSANIAQPMGYLDAGDVTGSSEVGGLFDIAPGHTSLDGVQLAGDITEGLGKDQGVPSGDMPEIPQERPNASSQRTGYLRAAVNWLARNSGLAGEIYVGAMNNIEWLKDYHDLVQAARDEPKTFEELQQGVGQRKPGYDDHHIVEQTSAERAGFTRSQIDDPENVVKIPKITHYQITGWYMTGNANLGGLSPREYLSDKSWEERRQVGLDALVRFKVLKP